MTPIPELRGVTTPSRAVVAPLILAALGLLVLAWVFQPPGTGGDEAAPLTTAPAVTRSDDGAVAAEPVTEEFELPLEVYEVFLSRDPFEPVVEEPEPDPAPGTDPTDPSAPTDPAAPIDPSAPTDPDDPDAPINDRCRTGVEVVCDGVVLTLTEIRTVEGERVAVIVVDGTTYQVRAGEQFAERFELVRIDDDRVLIVFGDVAFSLLLGTAGDK